MNLFRYLIPPDTIAWSLVMAVLILLLLLAAGIIKLGGGHAAEPYVTAADRAASADRSQPLRMKLEGQYPGPLQDTTVQRWRDPVDGTICYIYLPVAVAHSNGPAGLVQYGAANIGSISCMPPSRAAQ